MINLMFVHGAAANEKSWFDIPKSFTEEAVSGEKKYNVKVVRLAGHDKPLGEEPDTSVKMSDYLKSIEDSMDGLDDWVLIGHSMGGMVISQFASDFPDRVKKLIFVTAILPREGETVSSILGISDLNSLGSFLKRVAAEFKKHTDTRIPQALSSQPPIPLNEPFRESSDFAKIPRYYIYCDDDGVILPAQQKDMVEKSTGGVMKTTEDSIFSDHIVQLAKPSELIMSITRGIHA